MTTLTIIDTHGAADLSRRSTPLTATLFAVAMLAPAAALACGVCVEDKVAATYDHAVIQAAIEARGQVVFVALDGRDATHSASRITAAAGRIPGAQKGSVRFAASPPAFSFALAKNASRDDALSHFRQAVSDLDVQMSVIRVMRDGVLVEPQG